MTRVLPLAGGRRAVSGASAERGFSLIELLVVVVIIGLLSSIVVLTMADPRGRLSSDIDRFAGRVRAARDSAIISGLPVALWVSPTGYGFQRRTDGDWAPIDEGPLAASDWVKDARASFSGGSQLRAVFDTVGRADQPLDFTLQRGDQRLTVRVDLDGHVKTGG